MKTFTGSCHCGNVRWEADMDPPEKAYAGNCSICSRAGWLLSFVPDAQFRLVAGEGQVRDYQFAKKNTHHFFCANCGVRSFSRGKSSKGEAVTALNLRCIPELDVAGLPVESFDCKKL